MAVTVVLCIVVCYLMTMVSATCDNTTTMGTHFVFAIPQSRRVADRIAVHISSRNTAHVSVDVPFLGISDKYTVDTHLIFNVSNLIQLQSDGTSDKVIIVRSDVPCSVTVLPHDINDSGEGFLALPVSVLSTKYIVSSYRPYSSGVSDFVVIGIENNTEVYYKLQANGLTSTQDLDQYTVFSLSKSYDLSGAVITSNKPIVVISGASMAQIPTGSGDFQFLVEQLLPVKYWSKTYIVHNLYPRNGYYVRVYGNRTNVSATDYNSASNYSLSFNSNNFAEIHRTNSKPTVIVSSEVVSVMQYGDDGTDNKAGDPFMTTVQAISQYQSRYDFVSDFTTFHASIWDLTLVVTALTSDIPAILLDNQPIFTNKNVVKEAVPPPFDNYTVAFLNITYKTYAMYHTLSHPLGHRFGATVYSFPHVAAAYGYPLSLQLSSEGCFETTKRTTTTTTTTTTTAITTTTSMTSNISLADRMHCFNCRDIPHLRYCDHVTTCGANEICYVEKYNSIFGEILYRSGCIDQKVCSPNIGQSECMECCDHGDFCNMKGCGDQGVQAVSMRGPYCFDCNHVGEADECHSVQVCQHDEMCMIEKYVWGPNDFNYAMGCVRSNVCQRRKRSVDVQSTYKLLNTRHLPACTDCCTSDFCNRNCTHINHQVIIG